MVLQGTLLVEKFYFSKFLQRNLVWLLVYHCTLGSSHTTVTNFSLLNISQCRMEKQLWTRPELKVTEKWSLYYFLSVSNVLYYPNQCRFLRGNSVCISQWQCAAFVRGRAWRAGSIEERPFLWMSKAHWKRTATAKSQWETGSLLSWYADSTYLSIAEYLVKLHPVYFAVLLAKVKWG